MTEHIAESLRLALHQARIAALRKSSKLCVHDGDRVHPVLRLWEDGFSLAAKTAPILRGHVDLYDGSRHLYQCLVVASRVEEDERVYEFKWHTRVADQAPVDFARDDSEVPRVLIPPPL